MVLLMILLVVFGNQSLKVRLHCRRTVSFSRLIKQQQQQEEE